MIINHIEQERIKGWINTLRLIIFVCLITTTLCSIMTGFMIIHPLIIMLCVLPPFITMVMLYYLMSVIEKYKDSIYKLKQEKKQQVDLEQVVIENPLLQNEAL